MRVNIGDIVHLVYKHYHETELIVLIYDISRYKDDIWIEGYIIDTEGSLPWNREPCRMSSPRILSRLERA